MASVVPADAPSPPLELPGIHDPTEILPNSSTPEIGKWQPLGQIQSLS